MVNSTYEKLLEQASRISQQTGGRPEMVFDPIGLLLINPPAMRDYFCTPRNSLTFAHTGGDGVHFGLLLLEESPQRPVVMTVPMAEANNFIVGESLYEFLSLGLSRGFFFLEQLAYDWEGAITFHEELNGEMEEGERLLLEHLRDEFGLKPWKEVGHRLDELEQKYFPRLQIPDFEEWRASDGI